MEGREVSVERLPAGRYVHLVHTGPFDGLVAAHAAIDDWADCTGHTLESDLGARVGYHTKSPTRAPRPISAKWVAEVEEPLSFGRRPVETTSLGALDNLPARDWDDAHRPLVDTHASRTTIWLSTVNADGRPHAVAVGALFVEGAWWFTSGPGTRQVLRPRCQPEVLGVDSDRRHGHRRRGPGRAHHLPRGPATAGFGYSSKAGRRR